MPAAALEAQVMEQRRSVAVLLALGLGALALGASLPAWLRDLAVSAAWFLGAWLAVSIAAAVLAVRWFRRRARANELMSPEGGEVELEGDPTEK